MPTGILKTPRLTNQLHGYSGAILEESYPKWYLQLMDIAQELARLAKRYVWWKTPEEALENPEQIMAQVMNLGDWDDACRLVHCVGKDALRRVIREAEAGMFNARSWHFWHYRLGLAEFGCVPPLPTRRLDHDRTSVLAQ